MRGQEARDQAERKAAMATLAQSSGDDIVRLWNEAGLPSQAELLRGPETGLVTVRGRIGGGGAPFNLGRGDEGDARLRCGSPSGQVGHCYALGRDKQKAKLAAIADARSGRTPARCRREVEARLIVALAAQATEDRQSRRTAARRDGGQRRSTSSPWSGETTDGRRSSNRRRLCRSRARCARPVFRATVVMDAMALTPARVRPLPARWPSRRRRSWATAGAVALALTVLDHDSPVWLDPDPLQASAAVKSPTGCGSIPARRSSTRTGSTRMFALVADHLALRNAGARKRFRHGHRRISRPLDDADHCCR